MDWFDFLAVQVTLKSLLQHHSLKTSILQCSAFLMAQLSHPYMTTGRTIALTIWTFVTKVRSLLYNMLSRLVITFLTRSKHLLISWLQSPFAVVLEPPKTNSVTVSTVSPSICHEVMGPDAMILKILECWVLSQLFHSPLSLSSRGSRWSILYLHLYPYPSLLNIFLWNKQHYSPILLNPIDSLLKFLIWWLSTLPVLHLLCFILFKEFSHVCKFQRIFTYMQL